MNERDRMNGILVAIISGIAVDNVTGCPEGILYAGLVDRVADLQEFRRLLGFLVERGAVTRRGLLCYLTPRGLELAQAIENHYQEAP